MAKAAELSDENIVLTLRQSREVIMKADGDRDYMNSSNLTVRQTTAIADFIRIAIARLEP